MATLLPIQLHISLNARLFKVFNLREQRTFTIAHLRNSLGTSFHISPEQITFNLVSGRFTHDTDALFDLRASDGNCASLDVELPSAYAQSSLSNAIISVSYHANTCPPASSDASPDGIEEVPLCAPTPLASLASSSTTPAPFLIEELSREQRIALRAQLEDPFSIASKSCFEDDSDEEEDYDGHNDDSDSDADDDLYSDDGEIVSESGFAGSDCSSAPSSPTTSPLTSPVNSSFAPAKLTAGHLRHLLSIVPHRDPRRETPLRNSLLRYAFQRSILARLEQPSIFMPTNALENLKLTPTPRTCPVPAPVIPVPTKAASTSTLRDAVLISP